MHCREGTYLPVIHLSRMGNCHSPFRIDLAELDPQAMPGVVTVGTVEPAIARRLAVVLGKNHQHTALVDHFHTGALHPMAAHFTPGVEQLPYFLVLGTRPSSTLTFRSQNDLVTEKYWTAPRRLVCLWSTSKATSCCMSRGVILSKRPQASGQGAVSVETDIFF